MDALHSFHNALIGRLQQAGDWIVPLFARFTIAATLVLYYWTSAMTKLGDGLFGLLNPSVGAYAQIFPRQLEAVGYDSAELSVFHWLVVVAGTVAEFALPALIVIGLFTRLAALGMIGFVIVQSLTDVYGHGMSDPQTLGAWFDKASGSLIMDQRLFWVFTLTIIVFRGAGALSLDTLLRRRMQPVPA